MPNAIKQALDAHYAARPNVRAGRVTARPLDANGQGLGYVTCDIGGQAVNVRIWPEQTLFVGDWIAAEQVGSGAAATYQATGWLAGPRPNAQATQFSGPTSIGGVDYQEGDLLWGDPFGGHFDLDYAGGKIWLRAAARTTGYIDAANGIFGAGDPNGLHGEFRAEAIEWKNGSTLLTSWDVAGRTIYGLERLGRPLGPAIEWGPIPDASGDTSLERFGFWLRNKGGDRFFAVLSGSEANPDDASFRVGAQGDPYYLQFQDQVLDLAAQLHVLGNSEVTGNLAITNGVLTWANGAGKLNASGMEFAYGSNSLTLNLSGLMLTAAMKGIELGNPTTTYLNRIWSVGDGAEIGIEVEMSPDETTTKICALDAIVSSATLFGTKIPAFGVRVTGVSDNAPATGIYLDVTGDDAFAIQVAAGKINFGGIVVQSVGDATAATDALNRQTGDGRYIALPATPERGDVIFYSGSAWARLAHGTAGQVLKSGGHGADPYWG